MQPHTHTRAQRERERERERRKNAARSTESAILTCKGATNRPAGQAKRHQGAGATTDVDLRDNIIDDDDGGEDCSSSRAE